MTDKKTNRDLEEFKYLIDSRHLTDKEKEKEREAILKVREARFRNRTSFEIQVARLLQLKYQMEAYLEESPEAGIDNPGTYFTKFLNIYVNTLYKKKKDFASDLSIDPIVLSQVLNNHRDPQDSFIHRLVIHSTACFEKVCEFDQDIWPRIFYQDKVCKFLSGQNTLKEAEAKYVKCRNPGAGE